MPGVNMARRRIGAAMRSICTGFAGGLVQPWGFVRGLKNAPEAVKAFEKARTLTLRSAEAQNSIGVQLFELGADAEAEKCLNRSIEMAPGYAFAHSNLGRLRDRQGRLDEAETCFARPSDFSPIWRLCTPTSAAC